MAAIVSVQFGAALASTMIPVIGPAATVTFRLVLSAGLMLAVLRPSWRGHSRRAWAAVLGYGLSLGLMNLTFYCALARLPIGVAVTVEFIGPLALSAVLSRRPRDGAAVGAALVGVVLISQAITVPWSQLDLLGIGFAAFAGACWAAYILASRAAGGHFAQLDGLTWALVVASCVVTPFGIVTAHGPLLTWPILVGGAGVALLSSAIPYSLELVALRSLSAQVFGIMLALEPVVAALAGYIVLHEHLDGLQLLGMALVAGASALVSLGGSGTGHEDTAAEELAELG